MTQDETTTGGTCRHVSFAGAWAGGHPGGIAGSAPSLRRARLQRLPSCPASGSAPQKPRRLPGCPRRRLRPASRARQPAGPCPPDGLPRPAARPGLPPLRAAALPTLLGAPPSPAEGPPFPSRPSPGPGAACAAHADPERSPGVRGAAPGSPPWCYAPFS